ncbi:transmembrane amino acid transporter protein-domain-containing protein [Lactarius pseudohatsudake]|nr:transmembrane amino acid transporter protein-domain-containing protein [Lactarius pseudohatsudake]
MVQAYHAVPVSVEHEDPDDGRGAEHEGSALLGGKASTIGLAKEREGRATLTSSVSNLANTVIGSGACAAFASAGIIPGMLTCLFSGAVGAFGLYLLSACARKAPHRRASFFTVATLTFPRAAVFFDAAIAIKCFGVSISYLIIIKSLIPNVIASLYHDLTSPDTNPPEWALSGRLWISLLMVVLVPLSFLRRLDSLRHTSYIALFSCAYLVVIVIVCHFYPLKGMIPPGEIHLIKFTPSFISTFPIQVFAFTCAQNLFPIFNEINNNSQKRMNIVIAVFGYITFGSHVTANIIEMYPSSSLFIAIGQLAIATLVLFSYPLQVHPCRNCLDKVFNFDAASDKDDVGDEHGSGDMTPLKHSVLTTAVVAGGFTIAYFVDNLEMVLSFVGATGSTTISFILPGLFYWKLTKDDPNKNKLLNLSALALACYGFLILVFCLSFNIYHIVYPVAGTGLD